MTKREDLRDLIDLVNCTETNLRKTVEKIYIKKHGLFFNDLETMEKMVKKEETLEAKDWYVLFYKITCPVCGKITRVPYLNRDVYDSPKGLHDGPSVKSITQSHITAKMKSKLIPSISEQFTLWCYDCVKEGKIT